MKLKSDPSKSLEWKMNDLLLSLISRSSDNTTPLLILWVTQNSIDIKNL